MGDFQLAVVQWLNVPQTIREVSYFRGCYVQFSTELGPEDVSLLERCPHFRGLEKGL